MEEMACEWTVKMALTFTEWDRRVCGKGSTGISTAYRSKKARTKPSDLAL